MAKSHLVIGTVIGVIIASVVSYWQTITAEAAVKVRPGLAEVGFFEAAMTGHGVDWLFYNSTAIGWGVTFAILIPIIALATWATFS